MQKHLPLHRVFHGIRFKVNKDWDSAEPHFFCPYPNSPITASPNPLPAHIPSPRNTHKRFACPSPHSITPQTIIPFPFTSIPSPKKSSPHSPHMHYLSQHTKPATNNFASKISNRKPL